MLKKEKKILYLFIFGKLYNNEFKCDLEKSIVILLIEILYLFFKNSYMIFKVSLFSFEIRANVHKVVLNFILFNAIYY